ncbi:MAG: IMP cyclohydrolase [Myxococcota bacterium]|jgi:IMP cyclohydrolase|nr:IMP cyclohydrolase [Myxococcota bacterium]
MELKREEDMTPDERAQENLDRHLGRNPYPGRGLVVGRSSDDDAWLVVYFIMGRSPNSRNRRFVQEGTTLRTEPVDVEKVEDPSLIIYEAMLEVEGAYLVSNGDQTRTIADSVVAGGSFDGALATRQREPDAPNYTPRISAMVDFGGLEGQGREARFALSILKANVLDPEETDRTTYRPARPAPGRGWLLTTYQGDGTPLPTFEGDPLAVPCVGTPLEVLETYWKALDGDNRISLAVKRIPDDGSATSLEIKNLYPGLCSQ